MREPAYTCPLINKTLKELGKAMNWLHEMELVLHSFSKEKKKSLIDRVVKAYTALHQAYHIDLEKIRTENTKLRAWGNHYKDRSRELAKVVKRYKKECENLSQLKEQEGVSKIEGT